MREVEFLSQQMHLIWSERRQGVQDRWWNAETTLRMSMWEDLPASDRMDYRVRFISWQTHLRCVETQQGSLI